MGKIWQIYGHSPNFNGAKVSLHTVYTSLNLQNDVAVTLSANARLFLLVIIPIEYLHKKIRTVYQPVHTNTVSYSFSNKASVDFTRNESLGSSAFNFSVNTHTSLASLLYLQQEGINITCMAATTRYSEENELDHILHVKVQPVSNIIRLLSRQIRLLADSYQKMIKGYM